ncbi:gentisate 1,2-dioxygenase [Sphingobium sp. JAI105]|uniref:cupin domain-containing protein n=1 Tax=Sphingobium sp. JAI105 TaxID=2787715 RepID=UPI0018CBC74F|nr:cupin domain-containing protein [Sphingobium sp. JAI105]MBG6118489.1 gentisate 1,2-dioxygenase [Sphingobium sp. JAI105]
MADQISLETREKTGGTSPDAPTPAEAQRTPPDLATFHENLQADSLLPLWEIMRRLAASEPRNGGDPIFWSWANLRRYSMDAGELITAAEAERRVLVLDNPAFAGEGRATNSLYAGIQLLLPGEVAASHRHTASALRLILEGEGGYTAVDGEQVIMSPGDFIVTPTGTFHDHGNPSEEPVLWLDGLDVFVVNLLNAPFGEDYPTDRQAIARPTGDSLSRYGSGLLPHAYARSGARSPMFWWPYERTKSSLDAVRAAGGADPVLGFRMNFIDPTTGQSPIKTMTASMSLFPSGFEGDFYRSISGHVCSVVEGTGEVTVDDRTWRVGPKDVFILPSWKWHRFQASDDLVIFSFSDEVLQRHLGFWRDERRPHPKA